MIDSEVSSDVSVVEGEVPLRRVSCGNEVQYGWLKGRERAQPLKGIAGYTDPLSGEIEVITKRHGRMAKVFIDPGYYVMDLGRPEEEIPKYRVVVPGIS